MADQPDASIPPEIDQFLAGHTRVFLFSLRADGSPTAHPMVGLYNHGRIAFSTYRKSAKTRNVQRTGQASCLVTTRYDDPSFRAVLFRGRARVLEAQQQPERRPGVTVSRVPSAIGSRSQQRLKEGKRIVIEVAPDEAGFLERRRSG